jgi:16S rRNA (cytosine967-C5)-methyltransferase
MMTNPPSHERGRFKGERVGLSEQLVDVAKCVQAVLAGRSLADVLPTVSPSLRPGVQALTFHALRHWGTAQALVQVLTDREPAPLPKALLGVALSLLLPETVVSATAPRYAPFTVVDQAVVATRSQRSMVAYAGMMNACLRRFLREQEALLARVQTDPVARWNYPNWWVERVQHDHPKAWRAVLRAGQEPASLVLRVNPNKISRSQFLEHLAQSDVAAVPLNHPTGEDAVRLERHVAVERLPGYAEGWFAVQDAAAQWAAYGCLVGWSDRAKVSGRPLRVLDACAAPGGKTAHLLEQAQVLDIPMSLWALEVDIKRNQRMHDNLVRLGWTDALQRGKAIKAGTLTEAEAGTSVRLRVADAAAVESWWDGQAFDVVLLDAPCTASGIVRRHPDVRWLRRASDVEALVQTQARLLEALWPVVGAGGRLVYATCSIFKAEGLGQAQAFVQRHKDVQQGMAPGHLLPMSASAVADIADNWACEHDGFFYSTFDKAKA